MRTTASIIIAAAIATAAYAYADTDIAIRFRSLSPGESLDWDSASGTEVQFRFWQSDQIAIAACAGFETWRSLEEYAEVSDDTGTITSLVNGNAAVIPIGLSVLYRHDFDQPGSTVRENGGVSFLLEAGFRYAIVNSSVYSEATVIEDGRSDSYADTIEIENALLAVMGAAVEIHLASQLALELGITYQMDLSDPGESWLGESIGTTRFEGFGAHAGVTFSF